MALSQTEVSQLYVALFGRASEGAGNTYWQGFNDAVTAIDSMLGLSVVQDYFGDSISANQAFIEHIYLNTLNKTYNDDSAGVDYWTSLLESGSKTRAEVIEGLIDACQDPVNAGDAQNQFNNRVEVSNYTADNVQEAPSDYATSLSFSGDLNVTYETSSIFSSKSSIDTMNDIDETDSSIYHQRWEIGSEVRFSELGDNLLFEWAIDGEYISMSNYTSKGNSYTQTTIEDNDTITFTIDNLTEGGTFVDSNGSSEISSASEIELSGSWSWNLYGMSSSEYLYYMQQADTPMTSINYDGLKANGYTLYNPNTLEDVGMVYAKNGKLYVVQEDDGGYQLEVSDGTTTTSYYIGEIA